MRHESWHCFMRYWAWQHVCFLWGLLLPSTNGVGMIHYWFCHDDTSLAFYEGNPPVTGGFPSQRASNMEPWCFFNVSSNKLLNKHSYVCYLRCHHDDVIKWKHFPRSWPFVRGIHWWPVNSPHKGQWRWALMFSLICVLNKRLSKQLWGWWFETPSCSLWRHCNVMFMWHHCDMAWIIGINLEYSYRLAYINLPAIAIELKMMWLLLKFQCIHQGGLKLKI